MALHFSVPSMIQESLIEKLLVSKYCIEYRKDFSIWNSSGCYGHPALVLLLSIADTIGSYVEGGSVSDHFKVLNNIDYYGLGLSNQEIDFIYKQYRCLSTHNSVIGLNSIMDLGGVRDKVIEIINVKTKLNLVPLYNITQKAVLYFLKNIDSIVYQGDQLNNILAGKT